RGNVGQQDLLVLCAVVRHTRARTVFEFGTFDGLTTWHLAANGGPRVRLWTLDLPPDHPGGANAQEIDVGGRFRGTRQGDRVEQIRCDSLAFDPEPFRGLIDFCFIDGGHDYVHVCRDTANALTMVRPGGVVFWNAYSRWWPGVQKCLDDLARSLPVFAVEGTALAALCVPQERGSARGVP
ncbi:MAG TPA: class I SAM-dependent methyltransferase, partial [Gemmataceae bacterium]|nr:class I SAM-dependent methyltransferase [Gemmataceae bacterium]